MTTSHPRYREIPLADPSGEDKDKSRLKIILFKRDEKLRSHALKHFANLAESGAVRDGNVELDQSLVVKCIAGLKELGCPYYVLGTQFPLCERGRGQCRLFNPCSKIVEKLENAYLEVVARFIRDGGEVPRYAYFFSDREGNQVFCTMPDRPVVLKAFALADGTYNLVTCYSGPDISFQELRDLEIEKMRNEARSRNISLYSDEEWGFETLGNTLGREDSRKMEEQEWDESGKTARKHKQRYYRSGAGSWRRYLDDCDDE